MDNEDMAVSLPDLLRQIQSSIEKLESALPDEVDGPSLSSTAKIPSAVAYLRAALSWRFAELCRDAFESRQKDRIVSAILLTRAAVETCAALGYLDRKVNGSLKLQTVGDLGDYLERLIMGGRNDLDGPEAISVLTFIDSSEKVVEGIREGYDHLCEYAHPNWVGTGMLFSNLNCEGRLVGLGRNLRNAGQSKLIGAINLRRALLVFEFCYTEITANMPAIIALCEAE